MGALAYQHAATQHRTRRDMAVVSDLAIMFHNRAGVHQHISSDSCGWLDDRTRHHLSALAKGSIGCNHGGRMNYHREFVS